MTDREFLDVMLEAGIALMEESRRHNLTGAKTGAIYFSPEEGWVSVDLPCNDKKMKLYRFDQFPEPTYQEV